MTGWERLQLLVGGFGEQHAKRALELLSPLIGADEEPGQQVRQSMTCSRGASASSLTSRDPR